MQAMGFSIIHSFVVANLPKGGWNNNWWFENLERCGNRKVFSIASMCSKWKHSKILLYIPPMERERMASAIIFSTIPFLLLPMFLDSKPSEDHDTSMVPTMLNHPSRRDHVGHNLFGTYKSEMKTNRNQMKSQQGAAMKPAIDFQKGLLFFHLKSTLKHPFCINWHFLLAPLKEKQLEFHALIPWNPQFVTWRFRVLNQIPHQR